MTWDFLQQRLDHLTSIDRLRKLVPRQSSGLTFIQHDRPIVNFGSNDYLGYAAAPPPPPFVQPVTSPPAGSGASPLVTGWSELHEQFAEQIARFESLPAAVVMPSGYAACCGTIATLPQRGDLILSDQLNHASLIDGCRLSAATTVIYPHRNISFIRDHLESQRRAFDRVWVVTDGVFSMDGHIAPLVELVQLATDYDAIMIVDEAHATGVLGERGRGSCEATEVTDSVAIRIGTLSKAIGSQGGFVAGPKVVIDYLINHCRPLIFSTAIAPAAVAAASGSLAAIERDDSPRVRVRDLARCVRDSLGCQAADSIESGVPIIPLIVGEDAQAVQISSLLLESGFYVPAIRPPTVPPGTARLRISISAGHKDEQIDGLIDSLRRLI